MKKYLYIVFLVCSGIFLKSCATPMGPTGGEQDKTPPKIVDTYPRNGTTNFDDDEVSFTFDQFIDRNSFRQNVSVQPDLGIQYEVDFRRKTAKVKFSTPLPDNTTIIVKLGTDVTDTDRNKLGTPFDLALSTGDVLDSGKISGRLLNAETGLGASGNRIFLYADSSDFSQRSRYVAETDTSGRFNFGYLSARTYRVFWVNDQNQDRIWDQTRESAQPFNSETFDVQQDDSVDVGTIYISTPDTTAPEVDGVGLLSEVRLRLRLSEEVLIDNDSEFILTDTLGNEYTRAIPLYTSEQDPTVLFAQSMESLSDSMRFLIEPRNITDKSENSLVSEISSFAGSAQEDTTALQTISHNSASGLFPNESLEITYSKFIDDQAVVDSLIVLEGDEVNENWPQLEVDYHILRISPKEKWEPGIKYQFRVWNPWTQEREQINPDIWQKNQLGEIDLTVENSDSTVTSYLTLTDEAESIRIDTTFTNSIFLDNLPPLTYRAIIYQDGNGDGKWNPGTVIPFAAPEPYAIRTDIPVREGFTSDITISYPTKNPLPVPKEEETEEPTEPNDNSNQ